MTSQITWCRSRGTFLGFHYREAFRTEKTVLFILQMISVKNQEVENGGKSIHGMQTKLKKM